MKGQVGKIETLGSGEVKVSIYIQKEDIPPDLMSYNFETVTISKGEIVEIKRYEFYRAIKNALELLVEKIEDDLRTTVSNEIVIERVNFPERVDFSEGGSDDQ